VSGLVRVAPEVASALDDRRPVVALETTLVSHGFPQGEGAAVGRASEAAVRAAGAIPATIAVLDGAVVVGLADDELERVGAAGASARKLGARDLAACVAQRALGATTVGATLAVCRSVEINALGTGGIGGVHRGWERGRLDVSADLAELARTRAVVVSSGAKSLLDVAATAEVLEALGVPLLGWRSDEVPLFYTARGGPRASARVETVEEVARVSRAHWELGGAGILLGRSPDVSLDDVEPLIEAALEDAERGGVTGSEVTPFVLAYIHERSEGATLAANRDLVVANAGLAGEVAVALAAGAA
jgi:pseudouridylate synthase